MSSVLPDIQRTVDTRKVFIDRVGVTGIKLPIRVKRSPAYQLYPSDGATLDTVGTFELAVSLPAEVKGTHMSRFTEVLNEHIGAGGVFSIEELQTVALELGARLQAASVFIKLELDYFMRQTAPASGRPGTAPLRGILEVEVHGLLPAHEPAITTRTGIVIEGKTCCPCSREISDFDHATGKGKGAHAQRSTITITALHDFSEIVWFEQLAEVAKKAFSSPIYPVLKRPDERAVTVGAYENPKFVEDVIRDVVVGLRDLDAVAAYKVRVQNAESIHYHDAVAEITGSFGDTDLGEDEA